MGKQLNNTVKVGCCLDLEEVTVQTSSWVKNVFISQKNQQRPLSTAGVDGEQTF